MTTYVYKSTTGFPVNADNYVVTVNPGLQTNSQIDSLDALIGVSIARYDDGVSVSGDNEVPAKYRLSAAGVVAGLTDTDDSLIYLTTALHQSAVPVGIAPSGTMGANGSVTLGTALSVVYSVGVFLYYPASAAYTASAAGFYWTVMSSTTVGTVYNNIYIPGTNALAIPTTPTAIVDAGSGAFTGSTAAIPAIYITVPANKMGANGCLDYTFYGSHTNSAGNKTYALYFGNTLTCSQTGTTSVGLAIPTSTVYNRGTTNRQVSSSAAIAGVSSAVPSLASVDTTAPVVAEIRLQHSSAPTDALVLEYSRIRVTPKA